MRKLWFICIFWVSQALGAVEAVPLTENSPIPLGRSISWIELAPDDPAFTQETPGAWMDQHPRHTGHADVVNFSFSPKRFWLEFKLTNPFADKRQLLLEFGTAWLDEVRLYAAESNSLLGQAGDQRDHRQWSENYRYPAFALELGPGETRSYWVSVRSLDNLVFPMLLWDEKQYSAWERRRSLAFGFYHGLLITICILNSAMYIFSRRKPFLIYSLYITSYTVLQFALDGFLAEIFPVIPPWFVNRIYGAGNFLTVGFAGLFALTFLNTKAYSPRFALFVSLSCKTFVGIGLLSLLSPYYGHSVRAALMVTLFYAPTVLICAWHAIRLRTRSAMFFTIAWAPLVVSIVLLALTAFAFLPSSVYSRSVIYLGIAMEFIILSIGLGDQLAHDIRQHAIVRGNLEAAEAVQKALIPAMPAIPGFSIHSWYKSADSTGGDWYEVIRDEAHDRLYCFIGDVTGHGISSTLVTSAVAGAVHAYLSEKFLTQASLEETLEGLLNCVNLTVHRTGVSSGRLLTMNLIGIDLKSYDALLLNAGHCHPLLFRGSKVQPLASQGSVLGISSDVQYVKKNFHLERGDVLFLYSDGLIHQHSDGRAEFKLHRLMRLAASVGSAEKIVELVRNRYLEIYGKRPFEDDASLLAIELVDSADAVNVAS